MPFGVEQGLAQLEEQGWTLAAVADELGMNWLAVYRWRDGTRTPENPQFVLNKIEELAQYRPAPRGDRAGRSAPER